MLFDPIRHEWVAATPEEIVRQELIARLSNELGFSPELMVVEKKISELPHLSPTDKLKAPMRRIDLLCFAKDTQTHHLYPHLLIECKAVPLRESMKRQLIGYNYYVKARFIALVGVNQTYFGYNTPDGYQWMSHIDVVILNSEGV